MTIYIDSDFRCHAATADGPTAVDTDFFDGKAPGYIEGYRFVPAGESWTREDGAVFAGEMVSPWRDWTELDVIQREYERVQHETLTAQNAEYEAALSEIETALGVTE